MPVGGYNGLMHDTRVKTVVAVAYERQRRFQIDCTFAQCGLSIDRDWNAAINVLNRGLTSLPTGGTSPCGAEMGAENSIPVVV